MDSIVETVDYLTSTPIMTLLARVITPELTIEQVVMFVFVLCFSAVAFLTLVYAIKSSRKNMHG